MPPSLLLAPALAVLLHGGPRPAPAARPGAAPRSAPNASAADAAPRTFVVQRVNGRGLPFDDRFSTTPGFEHRVHLERFLVRLEPGGTFSMTVWGAYKDARRGTPGGAGQVRDAAVRGRWTRSGAAVTLTPDRSKKGKQYAPARGELRGGVLTLTYEVGWQYAGGQWGTRRYVLGALHDPSYL